MKRPLDLKTRLWLENANEHAAARIARSTARQRRLFPWLCLILALVIWRLIAVFGG